MASPCNEYTYIKKVDIFLNKCILNKFTHLLLFLSTVEFLGLIHMVENFLLVHGIFEKSSNKIV